MIARGLFIVEIHYEIYLKKAIKKSVKRLANRGPIATYLELDQPLKDAPACFKDQLQVIDPIIDNRRVKGVTDLQLHVIDRLVDYYASNDIDISDCGRITVRLEGLKAVTSSTRGRLMGGFEKTILKASLTRSIP